MKSVGEGRLTYQATTADTKYYNIAKNLSQLNSRNEEITDRKGNLFGYWCKVTTVSAANDTLVLASIPNTWKVRNAFRRFHFARDQMFRDAGVTRKEMGKFGRTIRPYLSTDHKATGDQPIRLFDLNDNAGVDATGGEWTYTKLGATVPYKAGGNTNSVEQGEMVDDYELTVLDTHDIQTAESGLVGELYNTVSMVQAYVQDRQKEFPDPAASTIEGHSNPLASLIALSAASGEITEIAEDQELEAPPYDVDDAGDCVEAVSSLMPVGGTTAGSTAAKRSWGLFFFPAGLFCLSNGAANSNGLEIQVVGKELCKHVA